MKMIWKFPLATVEDQIVNMPVGAVVLTIQLQNGAPCLWVWVDPCAKKVPRRIITHGTGRRVAETPDEYIGTYQLGGGALVFHVFEAAL